MNAGNQLNFAPLTAGAPGGEPPDLRAEEEIHGNTDIGYVYEQDGWPFCCSGAIISIVLLKGKSIGDTSKIKSFFDTTKIANRLTQAFTQAVDQVPIRDGWGVEAIFHFNLATSPEVIPTKGNKMILAPVWKGEPDYTSVIQVKCNDPLLLDGPDDMVSVSSGKSKLNFFPADLFYWYHYCP